MFIFDCINIFITYFCEPYVFILHLYTFIMIITVIKFLCERKYMFLIKNVVKLSNKYNSLIYFFI